MKEPGCGTAGQWLFRICSGCWSGDEFVALSGHIIVIADLCMLGVEMKIHRFDVITMDGKAGGVWNIDSVHSASISLLFLAYTATEHVGGFARAWNGIFTLQKSTICMKEHWVLLFHDHYCLCFVICNSYIFVIDFLPCWHIIMWNR